MAGNAGAGTTDSNNYAVDTVPPSVPTTPPSSDDVAPVSAAGGPDHSSTATWTITYTASDATSGIASVELYVRVPGGTTYSKVATDGPVQDGTFTYTGTAQGAYRFHTIAVDRAGNREAAPASADVTTTLDTDAPSVRPARGRARVTIDLGAHQVLPLRFRVDEHVSATIRIIRRGHTIRSFAPRTSSDGVVERPWRGRAEDGSQVRPGNYRVVVIARDAAGNRARITVRLRVTR